MKDEIRAMKDEIKAVTDKIKELSATMTNKVSPAPNIKAFDKFRRPMLSSSFNLLISQNAFSFLSKKYNLSVSLFSPFQGSELQLSVSFGTGLKLVDLKALQVQLQLVG